MVTSSPVVSRHPPPILVQISRVLRFLPAFLLAGTAALALMLHVAFIESFNSARLGVVLVSILLLYSLRNPRLLFTREFALYCVLVTYMLFQLMWTRDIALAMNTLEPAMNFILILLLFGSLVKFDSVRAVLGGFLSGFVVGAMMYFLVVGFPFVRPDRFSYNAIALMYLFGLFVTVLLACHVRSARLFLPAGLVIMLHIVATTSIKTNLGILLGAAVAGVVYFRHFARIVWRNAVPLIVLTGALWFMIPSNSNFTRILGEGLERVVLGIEILQAREDLPGYSGLGERAGWMGEGLRGWRQNPIFGHGVEAFRSRYGNTSHTTVIDLLYNSGLIGLTLFYIIFLSVTWRALRARHANSERIRAAIVGAATCFFFITLSGTMHYNVFLAAFVGIGVALLGDEPERSRLAVEADT